MFSLVPFQMDFSSLPPVWNLKSMRHFGFQIFEAFNSRNLKKLGLSSYFLSVTFSLELNFNKWSCAEKNLLTSLAYLL